MPLIWLTLPADPGETQHRWKKPHWFIVYTTQASEPGGYLVFVLHVLAISSFLSLRRSLAVCGLDVEPGPGSEERYEPSGMVREVLAQTTYSVLRLSASPMIASYYRLRSICCLKQPSWRLWGCREPNPRFR
ncbi:hypothetical protein E4U09_008160, partial [Claviceps aff. purpurea]